MRRLLSGLRARGGSNIPSRAMMTVLVVGIAGAVIALLIVWALLPS